MITAPTEFSGLQVWLDASDTTRLFQLSGGTTAVAANLDPVGYWGDKSGNARHFTNIGGSATTRPTWVSSLSTVRFDGSNDYLSSFFNITYTAQTVFMVVTQRTYVSNVRVYTQVSSGGADDAATGYFIPCRVRGTAAAPTFGSAGAGAAERSAVPARSLSNFDVFTSWVSSTSGVNFINGSSGGYYGISLNYSVTLSRIGTAVTNTGGYFNGDISEVIVYNRALTNLERADVEYYLTRKWNFLNSIPRQVYGIKNGLWSSTDTWSVSAEPSPWNFPLEADNAYTNTFTITADSSTKVDTIRNSTLAPNISSGGSFVLANGVSLSANIDTCITNVCLISSFATTEAELYGTVGPSLVATAGHRVIVHSGSGVFKFNGPAINHTTANPGASNLLDNTGSGTIEINRNVFASLGTGSNTGFIRNVGSGTINFVGNIGTTLRGAGILTNESTGTINLTGTPFGGSMVNGWTLRQNGNGIVNVFGTIINNIYSTGGGSVDNQNGRLNIIGDVYSSSSAQETIRVNGGLLSLSGNCYTSNFNNIIVSTSTTPLSVYGNIINAPNGRQAIYAPKYQVFPTGAAQYTRQASNGYDSYVDYWTSNSTFSYPASSDVALGTTYSNSSLSGSMAVPSASSVALGALVGTTTGTASITLDNVLSQPIANLTTPNSIGARLKNITTSQALSAIVDSLEF